MKKALVLAFALVCAIGIATSAYVAQGSDARLWITDESANGLLKVASTGIMTFVNGATIDNYTSGTTLTITETNISLVGTCTFSGSANIYGAAIKLGYDSGAYLQIAVTDATGVTAVTHAGSGPTMSWTVPAWTNTNSTSYTTYTPSWVLGYDAGAAMTLAVTDTTGAVAISHAGSGPDITWTADSLAFTGDFSSDGATAALDGSTSVRGISAGFVSLEAPDIRFGFSDSIYTKFAVADTTGNLTITHVGGSTDAVSWTAAGGFSFVGSFSADSASTAIVDGATSFRGVSAGFTSLEAPANRLGLNATEYMQFATTVTTGATAITHTGSGPDVTWTADSLGFTGDFSSDGATVLLDGSTSVRGVSAGFTSLEAPDIRFGYSDSIYTKFAVADTTGNLTITHVGGSTDAVTWTAAGGFDLVGALAVDAVTGSSSIEATAFIVDDGDADLTVDSDNQTHASAKLNVPDFVDETADVLTTNLFRTWVPLACGLGGEDTDGVGTNGGGLVGGGAIDVTTYDFNDGAAGDNDVLCKVYDASMGAGTWDDLKTSSTLDAWTVDYQLQPDDTAEAVGDAFAIGFDEEFCEVAFNDLATGNGAMATYSNDAGKWQYSIGAGTWSDLTVFDNTSTGATTGVRTLQRTGTISFAPPSDWAVATYDGEEAYWIQWVFTATELTAEAIIDDTNKDEPIIPFPSDSLDAPYKLEIVAVRVSNCHSTVHDQNVKFIIGNFTDGTFSDELTWTASQYCDRYTLGAAIACDADDVIGILVTDDTSSTNNPIWAVELEVSYED